MSKKHPSTEELEHERENERENEREHEREHDRLEGERASEWQPPKSPESPEVPQSPEAKASPEEPWDTPEFHDQVRNAGFPTSHFGDSAFMAACWKLTGGAPPP
jgi:hypothetical protein